MKKALLQIHGAVFIWGFTGVLGRAITLDSVMLVWWRLLLTVGVLWLLAAWRGRRAPIPRRAVLKIGLVGVVLAMHWVSFYASIKLSNVTITLTCLSTTAFLSALIEPAMMGKKVDASELLLGLFAVAGISIIYGTHLQFSAGILMGLLSAVLTVTVSVFNKTLVRDYSPEEITLYQLTGGWIGLTGALPFFMAWLKPPLLFPSPMDWLWLAILSLVCTVLTFYLYLASLKKISAFTMNLVLTLEPVYGIALAFAIYREDEHLSRWFYAGFALIAFSVGFHMRRLLRAKP